MWDPEKSVMLPLIAASDNDSICSTANCRGLRRATAEIRFRSRKNSKKEKPNYDVNY
jgi:hypothetical protein